MQNLTISVPHQHGKAEARRRLQENIGTLRQQHGQMFAEIRETWDGDTMRFSVSAMGQSITGSMSVTEDAVHVVVALPWILTMLAAPFRQQLQSHVRDALEDKRSGR
jgi:hypothetical protein